MVVVRENLLDLVENLVILRREPALLTGTDSIVESWSTPLKLVVRFQGRDGFAFKLDDDAADLLRSVESEDDAARHNIKVGVEFGTVIEGYLYGHDGQRRARRTGIRG